MNPIDFFKTVYLGDRQCKQLIIEDWSGLRTTRKEARWPVHQILDCKYQLKARPISGSIKDTVTSRPTGRDPGDDAQNELRDAKMCNAQRKYRKMVEWR